MKIDATTTRLLGNIANNAKTGNAPAKPELAAQADTNNALSRSGSIGASGLGDFDAGKVQRLRSAIEAGTYQVNPEAIADGMLAHARAVLSSGAF